MDLIGLSRMIDVRRGQIWTVRLDPVVGSEQAKTRPCIVVQRNSANRRSPTTIICPIGGAGDRAESLLRVAVPVLEGGLQKRSFVLIDQVRTIDLARIVGKAWGSVTNETMARVSKSLRAIMDLES